ncbi:MAG: LptF/LptG family permease [Deltaproteobacteria bacterium]|nr:LptF/LptG family permease [Deltaproteobacteria bacterium]MBW2444758.1 LptF/LptG family permease [Deltaproteobacteria bacterium]
MRIGRTLSFYLAREVAQYAMLGFLALGSIIVAQNMFRRLDSLLGTGFGGADFFVLFGSVLSLMLGYLLPVGFLFGILVAVGRLSSDSEIVAMRSCGMGLRELLLPVALLAIPVTLVSGAMLTEVEPEARRNLRGLWRTMLSRGAFLAPGRFITVGERVVFVEQLAEENRLSGVVISDHSNPERPFLVVANGGRFYVDEVSSEVHLELVKGDIHFEPQDIRDPAYQRIGFERFDYPIEAAALLQEDIGKLKPRDMRMAELRDVIDRGRNGDDLEEYRYSDVDVYVGQIHRRFALAFTPLVFALVGVPLGLRRARSGRSSGALVCIVLIFVYYALITFGEYLNESNAAPPGLALWAPNLLFLLLAIPLYVRGQRGPV